MTDNPESQVFDTLKLLSKTASDLLIEEQELLDSELLRMSKLLHEAIINLSECFSVMSNQITAQAARLRAQGETEAAGANQDITALLSSTQQMSVFVSRAVISLQFEDILQQLIRHSRQRVEETENLLRCIHANIEKLNPDVIENTGAVLEILKNCQVEVGKTREALNLSNPAQQESMTKGDVTLF